MQMIENEFDVVVEVLSVVLFGGCANGDDNRNNGYWPAKMILVECLCAPNYRALIKCQTSYSTEILSALLKLCTG